MLRPKKNSYKEFDNEKKFLRLKNSPPPPHDFSNGPSLIWEWLLRNSALVKKLLDDENNRFATNECVFLEAL